MTKNKRTSVLKGTLDLLILRTLELEPLHGVGVADRLEQITKGTFVVGPGSLFPSLHRLEQQAFIEGEWRETPEGRRARFYRLTGPGRRQLAEETREWRRIVAAMEQVFESN